MSSRDSSVLRGGTATPLFPGCLSAASTRPGHRCALGSARREAEVLPGCGRLLPFRGPWSGVSWRGQHGEARPLVPAPVAQAAAPRGHSSPRGGRSLLWLHSSDPGDRPLPRPGVGANLQGHRWPAECRAGSTPTLAWLWGSSPSSGDARQSTRNCWVPFSAGAG